MDKIIALCVIVLISSCQKEEYFGPVNAADSTEIHTQTNALLYIGCEGNFQYSNASLSVLNLEEDRMENDVFSRANGFPVGDVLQSILHYGDSLFLVVNNSGLIRIVNDSTFEQIATIEGFNSPRHMIMLDDKTAIVSDYGGQKLTIVDVALAQITREVSSAQWTERMIIQDGRLYVSNMTDSALLVYELPSLNMVSEIKLNIEPAYLFASTESVLVVGNGRMGAQLLSSNQSNQFKVVQDFRRRISGAAIYESKVYILTNGSINQIDLNTESVVSFDHSAQTPYSIFVDDYGIYISDVIDYLSKGKVLKYEHDFSFEKSYDTGLIPQAFLR
jgi:hypothetical protein